MKLIKIFALDLLLTAAGIVQAEPVINDPLYILDGKAISKSEMKNLNPDAIASVNVLKGKPAISKYGKKARRGVVEITTKK